MNNEAEGKRQKLDCNCMVWIVHLNAWKVYKHQLEDSINWTNLMKLKKNDVHDNRKISWHNNL